MVLVERSGHANNNGIHVNQAGIVGGGGKTLRLRRLDFFRANAVDVRSALAQSVDFTFINVETGDGKLLFTEQKGERQSDIAESDDSDPGLTLLDFVLELIDGARFGRGI